MPLLFRLQSTVVLRRVCPLRVPAPALDRGVFHWQAYLGSFRESLTWSVAGWRPRSRLTNANRHLSSTLGYRVLEGGADNDEVFTFALVHYLTAGVVFRF